MEAVKKMKRFIVFVFAVAFVFVGLGTMFESVSAKFRSDEKAIEIIRAARAALGGESKIREVRGLIIAGKTTQADGTHVFDTEIAIQYPDKMMKKIDFRREGAGLPLKTQAHEVTIVRKGGDERTVTITGKDGEFKTSDGQVFKVRKGDNGEVTTEDGRKVIIHSEEIEKVVGDDGETKVFVRKPADGEKVIDVQAHKMKAAHADGMRDNQLLRTTLGLLLTAPEGMDVNYTFAGEGEIDGEAANIVNAEFAGQNYRLFISKSNNLPLALSYVGYPGHEVMHFDHNVPAPADGSKDVVMFKRKAEPVAKAEILVRFSDFRDAGGVQLPYRWTTLVGDKAADVFEVASYELNPANIGDRFKDKKTMLRKKAPDGK
jgi:hypothetical protein